MSELSLSGYQQVAVDRLLEHKTYGIFDVQGSGKTAVAINAIVERGEYPALIVVPAHLVLQWRDQLEMWDVPKDEIAFTPRGTSVAKRLAQLESDTAFQIVTYNMLTSENYRKLLLHPQWKSYTFDEAHRLRKGRKGKGGVWTPVSQLRTKTKSKHMQTPVSLLSGTPIVNDATDVFPLLHLANPYRYSSRRDFAIQTCRTYQTPYKLGIGPVRDPAAFRSLLGKYSIRRTWKDIPELAKLKRRDVQMPLELEPAELLRHRKIKKDYRDPATGEPLYSSAAMIHALRRLTVTTKVDAFAELLEDHPGRWLALCWYRDSALELFQRVKKSGRPCGHVDGGTSEKERRRALSLYNDRPNGILVGTLGALETGLNLQAGQNIAFIEQHYLSATNDQAVGRLFRRGQLGPVLVYWLHCLKTFDIRVKSVADKRAADIDRALDGFLDNEDWNE